jgi:hypothetical protein
MFLRRRNFDVFTLCRPLEFPHVNKRRHVLPGFLDPVVPFLAVAVTGDFGELLCERSVADRFVSGCDNVHQFRLDRMQPAQVAPSSFLLGP